MNRRLLLLVGFSLTLSQLLPAETTTNAAPSAPVTVPLPAPLTPPSGPTPRINGPSVFGVRPGSPFLYSIPATGQRPMTFAVESLPAGLTLDANTGRLAGSMAKAGEYPVTLVAKNSLGTARKPFRIVVGETISLTPPMGWNSYNVWDQRITQQGELDAARAIVAAGLDQHGWTYVNMDDGWQGERSGPEHLIQPDPTKFTDIKGMVDQIHALGLKAGIYHTPWVGSYGGIHSATRIGGTGDNPRGR